jgi:hypothetical protein
MRVITTMLTLCAATACHSSAEEEVLLRTSALQIVSDAGVVDDGGGRAQAASSHVISNCAELPLRLAMLRDTELRGINLRIVRLNNARMLNEHRELVERNSNGALITEVTRVGADEAWDLNGRAVGDPLFVTSLVRSHIDTDGRSHSFASQVAPQRLLRREEANHSVFIGIGYNVDGVTLLKRIVPIENGVLLFSESERIPLSDFQGMVNTARARE